MICCKIITNYNDSNGSFETLLNNLTKYGDVLWENGCLFFADTQNIDTDEKKISKILKKSGFNKFYVDSFTKENQPKESGYVTWWLTNKLIKINYKECEGKSQDVFKNISEGLDVLDEQIAIIRSQQQQQLKEKEEE